MLLYLVLPPASSKKLVLISLAFIVAVIAGSALFLYFHAYRAVPGVATGGPPPSLLSLAPSDAPIIIFADLKALGSSSFFQQAETLTAGAKEDPDYAEFVRETGFDYSHDLDRLVFAAWPDMKRDIRDVQAGRPPAGSSIAVADGQFDQAKINAYCAQKGKLIDENKHQICEIHEADQTTMEIAFLNPTRIAIAVGRDIRQVLSPSTPDPSSAGNARMKRVAGAPVFAIGHVENLPSLIPLNFGNSQQLQSLLNSIHGFAVAGVPKDRNFEVAADLDCDSGSHAFQLATLLDGLRFFGRAALADPKNRQQMTRSEVQLANMLLSDVHVAHDSQWLQLRLETSPAMLELAFPPPPKHTTTHSHN